MNDEGSAACLVGIFAVADQVQDDARYGRALAKLVDANRLHIGIVDRKAGGL